MFPSDTLYPSNTLYPKGDSRIDVTDETGNTVTYELGVMDVLRKNGTKYDEYILEGEQAKVIRRINKDGTVKSKEETENLGEYNIALHKGTNTIRIKNYSAEIAVKYAVINDYTNVFATKLEMNSAIEQTAGEINIEVSKKIDEDKIIAKINMSPEQTLISGDRINIIGKKVKFTTNIEGDYTYSQSDLDKIVAYIRDGTPLSTSEKELYDLNKDGRITSADYVKIKNAMSNNNGKVNLTGTFEIDPDSASRSVILRDDSGNIVTSIGLLAMQTQSLGTENFESDNASIKDLTVEGSFTNNSDRRLKEDIKELDNNYIKVIDTINPVLFTYKKDKQKHIGFIAQDVEEAFIDENIETTMVKKNELGIYSLDYIQMIGVLWKVVQEQQKEINKLKGENNG